MPKHTHKSSFKCNEMNLHPVHVFIRPESQPWKCSGRLYLLVEPTNTLLLVVVCDIGVEDDAMFGTEHLYF